jgi:hypothetical protein
MRKEGGACGLYSTQSSQNVNNTHFSQLDSARPNRQHRNFRICSQRTSNYQQLSDLPVESLGGILEGNLICK